MSSQRVFPLNECELEQMFGSSLDTDGSADVGSMFKITCRDKSLFLYSKSKLEAATWFKTIKDAMRKLKNCRASLRRVSRGESTLQKRKTPLQRSAVLKKSKVMRSSKDIQRKTIDFDCMSPAAFIKDSLYPLRKEIKKKKNEAPLIEHEKLAQKPKEIREEDPAMDCDEMHSSSDEETDGSVSELEDGTFESSASQRDVYSYEEEYDDDEESDDDDNDNEDPRTPSGMMDSGSHIVEEMHDSSSEYSESDSEDENNEEGVASRGNKKTVTIDEKENQFHNLLSPLPSKRMCILPKLLCGGVNRTPLSSSRK